MNTNLEDAIEKAFWEFDSERKRSGAERDAFKRQMRMIAGEAHRNGQAHAMGMSREVLGASGY